jgi:5-methylcytosine-specific restriction endonuclease McrA
MTKHLERIDVGKPKHGRQVTQLMKKKIAAQQQWKCGHCTTILDASYEVDHKIALYKGGSNSETNLIALCRNCHGKKTVNERLNL